MKTKRIFRAAILTALLAACVAMTGCASRPAGKTEIRVDGQIRQSGQTVQTPEGSLRVIFTLDGETLLELPFGEAHTVAIRQADGCENIIRMTGEAVYMESATCKNQDCVRMGEITPENLELRAMGGFIVCLPQKVTIEVR